jgi:hypothetical protein
MNGHHLGKNRRGLSSDDDYTESFDLWNLNKKYSSSTRAQGRDTRRYTLKRPKNVIEFGNMREFILSSSSEDTEQIRIDHQKKRKEKSKHQSKQKSSTLRTMRKKKNENENGIYISDNERFHYKKNGFQKKNSNKSRNNEQYEPRDDSDDYKDYRPIKKKEKIKPKIKKLGRKKKIKSKIPSKQIETPQIDVPQEDDSDSSHLEKENWGRLSNKTIKEMVDTEKIYLNGLRTLVAHYLKPLEELSNQM